MSIKDIKQAQKRLELLVRFSNHLGLTPRIGMSAGFEPEEKWSTIWCGASGNNLRSIYRSLDSLVRFLETLEYDLAHELAHYMLATPAQRKRYNYDITEQPRSAKENRKWDAHEAKVFWVENHLREWVGATYRKRALQFGKDFKRFTRFRADTKRWWKESGEAMVDGELLEFTKAESSKRLA